MEHIADSKPPVSFRYYKGRDMSNVKPVSSFIKKSSEEGKGRMEERSKMRRADIMKYSPLTIQAPQTKNKSPLDTIREKEKKKVKYKQ